MRIALFVLLLNSSTICAQSQTTAVFDPSNINLNCLEGVMDCGRPTVSLKTIPVEVKARLNGVSVDQGVFRWLQVNRGTSGSTPMTFTLIASASELPQGTYEAIITVGFDNPTIPKATLKVTLNVSLNPNRGCVAGLQNPGMNKFVTLDAHAGRTLVNITHSQNCWPHPRTNGDWLRASLTRSTQLALEFDRNDGKPRLGKIVIEESEILVYQSGPVPLKPKINAVLSTASYRDAPLAPFALVSIFGEDLALSTHNVGATPSTTVPIPVDGVSVTIAWYRLGASIRANPRLIYVSPTQINVEVPGYIVVHGIDGPYSAFVSVSSIFGFGAYTFEKAVKESAPEFFVYSQDADRWPIVVDTANKLVNAQNPTGSGGVVVIYMTGLGDVGRSLSNFPNPDKLPPKVMIDNREAEILYAGPAPGFVGLDQVNVVVPENVGATAEIRVRRYDSETETMRLAVAPVAKP